MAFETPKTVLDKAYKNGYAMGTFNVINLHFLEAMILTAQREPFDILLNLDQGIYFDAIERAVSNGFTSIMFDGSHMDFEEHIRTTREVVAMCRSYNISFEAELGVVGEQRAVD